MTALAIDPSPRTLEVLVVEDVDILREQVLEFLDRPGRRTRGAADALELDRSLRETPADVVVLDLGLPGEDGLSIAKRLRKAFPHLGLIMMTGRGEVADRALGYQSGADIYLPKPVHPDELEAALEALGRRVTAQARREWVLHPGRRVVSGPGGQELELTSLESRLLYELALAPQQRLSHEEIQERMHSVRGQEMTRGHLAVVVSRLRDRCESMPGLGNLVLGERGYGYELTRRLSVES